MLEHIDNFINYENGKLRQHSVSDPEKILSFIERLGMLPPETTNLSDAEIVIQPSYFKENVPQVFALGWDEE